MKQKNSMRQANLMEKGKEILNTINVPKSIWRQTCQNRNQKRTNIYLRSQDMGNTKPSPKIWATPNQVPRCGQHQNKGPRWGQNKSWDQNYGCEDDIKARRWHWGTIATKAKQVLRSKLWMWSWHQSLKMTLEARYTSRWHWGTISTKPKQVLRSHKAQKFTVDQSQTLITLRHHINKNKTKSSNQRWTNIEESQNKQKTIGPWGQFLQN